MGIRDRYSRIKSRVKRRYSEGGNRQMLNDLAKVGALAGAALLAKQYYTKGYPFGDGNGEKVSSFIRSAPNYPSSRVEVSPRDITSAYFFGRKRRRSGRKSSKKSSRRRKSRRASKRFGKKRSCKRSKSCRRRKSRKH